MTISSCIIAVNPIGTVIAIYQLDRMLKELWIEYE